MARKWKDVRAEKLTPEMAERVNQRVTQEIVEINLKKIREALQLTQHEMALQVNKTQPDISRMEKRGDYLLSTLQQYVQQAGGKLEVNVVFEDQKITLL
ncbi:MAG: XRE family transcriptional regulator [Candidatus Sericytochromatia bacterium]|nr:XRE family transcriptional regulator [Candidatus Sericytochromatia bacterium]